MDKVSDPALGSTEANVKESIYPPGSTSGGGGSLGERYQPAARLACLPRPPELVCV